MTLSNYYMHTKSKNENFSTEMKRLTIKYLEAEDPTQVQQYFVQTYFVKSIINVVTCGVDKDESSLLIKEFLTLFTKMKLTSLSTSIIQTLVYTLFLQGQQQPTDITFIILDLIKNGKDFPKMLQHDLFCLCGRQILEMVNPSKVEDSLNVDFATNLIMQSNLLSGGL